MADVIVKESPITSVLNSIPDILFQAQKFKANEKQQAFENDLARERLEIAKDNAELNKSESEYRKHLERKDRGMDAGGYDNMAIAEEFNKYALSKGTVNTAGGDLTWSGDTVIPAMDEAWAIYQNKVRETGKSLTSGDYQLFNQYYSNIINTSNARYKGQIKRLERMGYTPSEISDMIKGNPILEANISTVIDNNEAEDFYTDYLYHKPSEGILGEMGSGATAATAVGLGSAGIGGFKWATNTPEGLIYYARETYREAIKGTNAELKAAKDMLADAQKTGRTDQVKEARKILKEAQKKFTETRIKGRRDLKQLSSEKVRWKGWQGKIGKVPGAGVVTSIAPFLLGEGAGMAGRALGGEKTGAAAKGIVGGGIAGAQAMARTMSLGQYVAKRLAMRFPAMAATAGVSAMADSPLLPIGDIIGLAMAGGMGYSVVKDAMEEWNKANR